ncbi:MAG: porin [Rhodobacterales bacterium]
MKKTLLCTSALALTSITGAANAVPITAGAVTMNVSGYYTTTFAYVDVTGNNAALAGADFSGVDLFTNAEIWFKPSMTLDNGIKIAVDVQLEAGSNTNTDQIDESYMTISGNFGKVIIGSENSVGYKMTVAAPDVSPLYAQSSSLTGYVPYSAAGAGADLFRRTLGTTYIENNGNNDAQRISYFSPRFSGLQVGISYARDSGQVNGAVNNNAVITDIVDIAANYSGSFNGVDINASARYGTANAPAGAANPEIWGGGLTVGYAGFTLGGSYAEQNDSPTGGGVPNFRDGNSYDIGLGYSNGPMTYSFTYFRGKNADNAATNTTGFTSEELKTYVLAAKYKVADNFSVSAFAANTEFTSNNPAEGNIEGTVVGIGASFNF